MFIVGGKRPVSCADSPPILEGHGLRRAHCDQWLNCKNQAFSQDVRASWIEIVWDRRSFMNCSSDTVASQITHNRVAIGLNRFVNRLPYVECPRPGTYCKETGLKGMKHSR
jgi:hypothetical protein